MADNVGITTGTDASIATDDIAGAQYQRVKLIHGADGVNAGDVSSANGLPVNIVTVAGSPARTADLDTGAGTDTHHVVGIAVGAAGGAYAVTETDPFPVNVVGPVSVTGSNVTASTTATGDAAGAVGDLALTPAFVRDDALTTLTVLDAQYTQGRVDSTGALWTREKQPATGTLSNVSGSASSSTILAANASRRDATIWNDSAATLYLKYGATASTTSCTVKIAPDAYYEVIGGYTGILDGIWSSATGAARVTEIT